MAFGPFSTHNPPTIWSVDLNSLSNEAIGALHFLALRKNFILKYNLDPQGMSPSAWLFYESGYICLICDKHLGYQAETCNIHGLEHIKEYNLLPFL